MLLQVRAVSHSVVNRNLFHQVDLTLNANARIGLVGYNGCGKSTLLGLLSGRIPVEVGEISRRRGLRLAEVEQFLPSDLGQLDLVSLVMERGVERWQAEAMLSRLGFATGQFEQVAATLSGGQHNRLLFARALVVEPELLLLDEPTNHMDLATLQAFELVLAEFPGAVLTVSHDREFLDRVTSQTVFLRDERLHHFTSSYTPARQQLEAQDAAAQLARAGEEKQLASMRASAKRLKTWGRDFDSEKLSRRAQNMEKRIEKLAEQTTEVTIGSRLQMDVELSRSRAKQVLRVSDLAVTVSTAASTAVLIADSSTAPIAKKTTLFHIDELVFRPGERVALLGGNGVGKTTFIKMLVAAFAERAQEHAPLPGISLSPQTELGYYDQDLQQVATEQSMLDFAARRALCAEDTVARALIHAGFSYEAQSTLIHDLSGGERARLLFVLLSLAAPNFLILDEPTNHIDIDGKEQLEEQLQTSGACLLITSHDRRFIESLAQRFLWIHEGRLQELTSPEPFYAWSLDQQQQQNDERTSPKLGSVPTITSMRPESDAPEAEKEDEETRLLLRLDALETKLKEDLARKPKFQKPLKQQQWRDELAQLALELDSWS